MGKKLYLRTPYGNQYHIHENGAIQRLDLYPADQPFDATSPTWTLRGIRHVKRNQFIPLAQLFANGIPGTVNGSSLTYKNGNPEWTGEDIDHGTRRVWGNTKYHGIADLRVIDEP